MSNLTHITDFLRRNALDFTQQAALVTEERTFTWDELWRQVKEVSQKLRYQLPQPDQQLVSLLMPNSWHYVVAYLAVLEAGHIVVPIDVIYKPLEIDAILAQMKPAMLITDDANRSRVKSDIVLTTLEELASQPASDLAPVKLPAEKQVATIFFTSGTTGKPKAAPYTHANHIWNIEACSKVWGWDAQDSLLLSLRLSHWYGSVMGLTGVLYHGNRLYLQDRFSGQETLRMLASGQISLFTHAPLAYSKMLETAGDYDLSKVRLLISGSGPLPPKVWQAFKDRFGQEILEVYGSSETGRIASNRFADRQAGSPGRLLPGVKAKLGKANELLVKSPGLFPGYYKNPELNRRHLTAEGFWRTGDVAQFEDDRLYLKGRLQEVIRKQGYTVSPRDIEWALHTHPQLQEISVVGLAGDNGTDDQLVYFVVSNLSDEQIMTFCKQALPSIWRPDRIVHLASIPRTNRGKIDIGKLKSLL